MVLLDAAFQRLAKKKIERQAAESSIADPEAESLFQEATDLFENLIKDKFDGVVKDWPEMPASRRRRAKKPPALNFTKYVVF